LIKRIGRRERNNPGDSPPSHEKRLGGKDLLAGLGDSKGKSASNGEGTTKAPGVQVSQRGERHKREISYRESPEKKGKSF